MPKADKHEGPSLEYRVKVLTDVILAVMNVGTEQSKAVMLTALEKLKQAVQAL